MILPKSYKIIEKRSQELGFTMPSDVLLGNLLRSLVASKPAGNFLELGTGTGLSLSWMLDGMDDTSKITSIENNTEYLNVAQSVFQNENRMHLLCDDAAQWIANCDNETFDLIFADTWAGKYTHLDKTLALLKPGGFYIVDDMNEQKNWPSGHAEKAKTLENKLKAREDFYCTLLNWSTGIIMMTKKQS